MALFVKYCMRNVFGFFSETYGSAPPQLPRRGNELSFVLPLPQFSLGKFEKWFRIFRRQQLLKYMVNVLFD